MRYDDSGTKDVFSRRTFTRTAAGLLTAAGIAPFAFMDADTAFAATQSKSKTQAFWSKPDRVLGHDLSILQQLEDAGKTFSYHGIVRPADRILAAQGANYVRLRLWVNPPMPYNDLPHVLKMARRLKSEGLKFHLDFHYSDFWADPGKQNVPQAWVGQDLATLTKTVHDYTQDVLTQLDRQGTRPDIVQIGNEVTNGMLWPLGEIYLNGTQNWSGFTTLLKAGIQGAHDAQRIGKRSRIMIHIDRGGDNAGTRYFFDGIQPYNVEFDLIGLSYYPFWHGPLTALQTNLNDISPRYQKDIVIAETAYPWTFADGDSEPNSVPPATPLQTIYPATPTGQLDFMRNLLSIVQQVPHDRGLGVVYWEPEWIPGVGWEPGGGDGWDNMTLFDWNGKALPAIACYKFSH
jgi:arabinogalactan endo-1,4-beta-galactosidase